jgi:hypothetical protein
MHGGVEPAWGDLPLRGRPARTRRLMMHANPTLPGPEQRSPDAASSHGSIQHDDACFIVSLEPYTSSTTDLIRRDGVRTRSYRAGRARCRPADHAPQCLPNVAPNGAPVSTRRRRRYCHGAACPVNSGPSDKLSTLIPSDLWHRLPNVCHDLVRFPSQRRFRSGTGSGSPPPAADCKVGCRLRTGM